VPYWVIEGQLAISSRPGYQAGAESAVPREAVDAWIRRVRRAGVASILCLLDGDQLPLYEPALPQGLVAYYREAGFQVAHVPAPDGLAQPFTAEQYERIWRAFVELPKPVLVHCSAGFDRTGRAVNHILRRLRNGAG
jgi:protein tyrosine phosphatase (PTP) superfamily phosphohydrolase (DUF442 family)